MIKHRCQIDPWSPPRTPLGARSLLGILISTFLAPFGTPMGPQNRSKIDHVVDLFLNDFWEPLFHAFGFHLASKTTSKMRPKRDPTPIHENHRFCFYLQHVSHIQGSQKMIIFDTFLIPFLRCPFGTSFWSIFDPFGDPLGTH